MKNQRVLISPLGVAIVFALTTMVALLLAATLTIGIDVLNQLALSGALFFITCASTILYFLLIWRDKRQTTALEVLVKSEERFRSLVEKSQDWLWEVNTEGVYTYSSPQCEDLLGYRPEEIVGKTPFDLMSPEEAERVRGAFADCVNNQRPITALVNVNLHKNGNEIVMETSGSPILTETGELLGYQGVDRDITERRHTELNLRANEQL